jgi:hypothetical protein
MLRITDLKDQDYAGLKLYRAPVNEYGSGEDRPDLEPSTLIPMGIRTSWVNPGGAVLLKRGDITELTPLGPASTDVYPGVAPAPTDTQDIEYEDRIPRIAYRGDQVLRSRSGIRGPAQYWKYGGLNGPSMGQPELNPVLFYNDPSEVAYQTYPGPFLGQVPSIASDGIWTSIAQTVVGGLIAMVGPNFARNQDQKTALVYIGGFAGAIGVVNLISAIAKK